VSGSRVHLQVEGTRQLRKTLKAAGDDLSDLKDVNQAVATVVANAGRGRAPVRTGALAGSLRPSRAATKASIRSRLPYAGPVHWGWPAHSISPNPFLADAATQTEPEWLGLYEREIAAIVAKVSGA
jgi:hypothetical protein